MHIADLLNSPLEFLSLAVFMAFALFVAWSAFFALFFGLKTKYSMHVKYSYFGGIFLIALVFIGALEVARNSAPAGLMPQFDYIHGKAVSLIVGGCLMFILFALFRLQKKTGKIKALREQRGDEDA